MICSWRLRGRSSSTDHASGIHGLLHAGRLELDFPVRSSFLAGAAEKEGMRGSSRSGIAFNMSSTPALSSCANATLKLAIVIQLSALNTMSLLRLHIMYFGTPRSRRCQIQLKRIVHARSTSSTGRNPNNSHHGRGRNRYGCPCGDARGRRLYRHRFRRKQSLSTHE